MTNRGLLELIAAQVGKLNQGVGEIKQGQETLEILIENDIRPTGSPFRWIQAEFRAASTDGKRNLKV